MGNRLKKLTAEKSLWQVWRNVVRRIPTARRYHAMVAAVAALAIVGMFLAPADVPRLGDVVRDTSTAVFSFAASILSVIVAGFAIFSVVATSKIIVPMALVDEPKSGLPFAKHIAGAFVKGMLPYLLFLGFHCVVMLFGWKNGPISALLADVAPILGYGIWRIMTSLAFGGLTYLVGSMIVSLQALVFNIFMAFMMMARFNAEDASNDTGNDADSSAQTLNASDAHPTTTGTRVVAAAPSLPAKDESDTEAEHVAADPAAPRRRPV